jgi:polysaccharide export outer membrane protein
MVGLSPRIAGAAEPTIQNDSLLSIQVSGEPSLSKEYTVNGQGDITMDMLGKVHLGGQTPDQAKETLTKGLTKYLKLFEVTLSIVGEYGGRVLVYGEVLKPGAVRVRSDSTLLDVLAEAGQPTAAADTKHIKIVRKETKAEEVRDLEAILKDNALNTPISAGDTVTVPSLQTHLVQIDGEVKNAGMRSLDYYRTAYAAIMSAGPTEQADWTRIALRHQGSSLPMMVDMSSIRSGEQKDDLELQPGDHLTVMSRILGSAVVRGEVKVPGEKPLASQMQVWDFIATVGGGFTDSADRSEVEIQRDGKTLRKVNLEDAAAGKTGSADAAVMVKPGDVVFVPNNEKKQFAIIGGVRRAGRFVVRPGMKMLDAVVAADGLNERAVEQRIVLAPEDPKDDRLAALQAANKSKKDQFASKGMAVIDYKKLASGDETQNVPIKPGDRILVPEKEPRVRRSFFDAALGLIPFAGLILRGY